MAAKDGDENWSKLAAKTAPIIAERLRAPGAGRPQVYDRNKVQAEIVTRLCCGESLPVMCQADESLPSLSTINAWMAADRDFADAVKSARQVGVETLMDACYSIAAGEALSTGSIERDKLLCSVIKWIVAKRDPANAPCWKNLIILRSDADDLC